MFVPVDIVRADPGTLRALADYFDGQAKLLRDAAADRIARERDAAAAHDRRQAARQAFLRMGARCHVIGIDEVIARIGVSRETAQAAHRAWSRLRLKKRNLEIWKAKIAGAKSRDLAARYGLTVRQVDKIASRHGRTLSAR